MQNDVIVSISEELARLPFDKFLKHKAILKIESKHPKKVDWESVYLSHGGLIDTGKEAKAPGKDIEIVS